MRYRIYQQSRSAECGLACCAMLLRRCGVDTTLNELREKYVVSRDGLSSKEVRLILMDFEVPSIQCTGGIEEMRENLNSGAQILTHLDGDHFCLVEKITQGTVRLADPGAGRHDIPLSEFLERQGAFYWTIPDATGIKASLTRARLGVSELRRSPSLGVIGKAVSANKALLGAALLLSAVLMGMASSAPMLTSKIIDSLSGNDGGISPGTEAFLLVGVVATAYLAVSIARTWMESRLVKAIDSRLSAESYQKLLTARLEYLSSHSPGEMLYSLNSAPIITMTLASHGTTVIFNGLLVVTMLVIVTYMWTIIGLMFMAVAAVLLAIFAVTFSRTSQYSRDAVLTGAKGSAKQLESIVSMTPIRISAAEGHFYDEWSTTNGQRLEASYRRSLWSGYTTALTGALTVFGPLLPIVIALSVGSEATTIGTVVASSGLFSILISNLTQAFTALSGLSELRASITRVDDVLSAPQETFGDQEATDGNTIAARDLSYRYPGAREDVFTGLNFEIRSGANTALVGPSGCGKSTLARMLCGLTSPSTGSLTIGGVPANEMEPKQRARIIGFVPQETHMVSGSIRENVAFGRDIADDTIVEALRDTEMLETVRALPLGLSTPVGEMGSAFSGGQRQRLALARALAAAPRILILDEATSAIDVQTEKKVMGAIRRRGITVISIAHRPTAMEESDQVCRLHPDRLEVEKITPQNTLHTTRSLVNS